MAKEIPAYLSSLQAFEGSVSYDKRENIVQNNEKAWWVKWRYVGDSKQNMDLIRFLQDNPRKRAEWETRVGLTQESLKHLKGEYESTKRKGFFGRVFSRDKASERKFNDVAKGGNPFKKKTESTKNINTQWGKAIEALSREEMFTDINNELVRAWRKDIRGKLITGGAIGLLLGNRTSALNKAIQNIEQKYPGYGSKIVSEIRAHLQGVNELSKAAGVNTGTKRGLEFAAGVVGGTFGWENQATIQKIQSTPDFTGRLQSLIQTAIGFGVYSALGSPTIYLGSLNTGIKMKDVRNANKDVIANALFGSSFNTVIQDTNREFNKYNKMLADNGVNEGTRWKYDQAGDKLEGVVREHEESASEGYKALSPVGFLRVLREVFSDTPREKLIDSRTPLSEKFALIDKEIQRLGDKKQTDAVRAQITQLQILRDRYGKQGQLKEHRERDGLPSQYHEALRVMNMFSDYDSIRDYNMPKATKEWMRVYLEGGKVSGQRYQARDKSLLMYLWDSNATPGFQKFIQAMASGKTREYNDWVVSQEGTSGKRGGPEYGRDISNLSVRELSTYLDSTDPKYGRLANIYANQLNNLSKNNVHVNPDDIVKAAKNAVQAQEGLINTGRYTNNINNSKRYNGTGFYFDVPVTITGEWRFLVRIGVKPNCSNLQIGDITGRQFYDSTNIPSQLNWRIPLSWKLKQDSSSTPKEKEVKTEKTTTKTTPKSTPKTPPQTPPEQPQPQQVSSQPGYNNNGGVIENPGWAGYDANNTGTFVQNPSNTTVETGSYTPQVDGTAPATDLWIPTNTSTNW